MGFNQLGDMFESMFEPRSSHATKAVTVPLAELSDNPTLDDVLYAILDESSLVAQIVNSLAQGIAYQTKTLRKYAQNHYTLGLPTCTLSATNSFDSEDLSEIIAEDVGASYGVEVGVNFVDIASIYYGILPYLYDVRGWNATTNQVSNIPASILALDEIKFGDVPYKAEVYNATYNAVEKTVKIVFKIYYARVTTVTEVINFETVTTTETAWIEFASWSDTVSLPTNYPLYQRCCIATYYLINSEGTISDTQNWWYYVLASNKYDLNLSDAIDLDNQLFPIVPLRSNNVDLTSAAYQDTELYITSKRLMAKIGIDIDDAAASLNESSSIDDIDHAYIMWGVSLQTDNQSCLRYLVRYFDYLADNSLISSYAQFNEYLENGRYLTEVVDYTSNSEESVNTDTSTYEWFDDESESVSTSTTTGDIQRTLVGSGLNVSISFTVIRSDLYTGTIGEVGEIVKTWYSGVDDTVATGENEDEDNPSNSASVLILQEQLTDTVYRQIYVRGLVHYNYLNSDYYVMTTLAKVIADEDENNFIIPLHYGLLTHMRLAEQNEVTTLALILVLTCYAEETYGWYTSPAVLTFIMVISLIIAIKSGQYWIAGLMNALTTGACIGLIIYLLETIILYLVFSYLGELLSEKVGPLATFVIALVIAIISKNFSALTTAWANTTAQLLMTITSALIQGAQNNIHSRCAEIDAALESIEEQYEDDMEVLEDIQEEYLDYNELLTDDLLKIQTKTKQPPAKTPSKFYDLLIHTGNIGVLVLDITKNFHTQKLVLPEPKSPLWI